ncbi:fasciclin-like arabinogalactan protein 2 [Mangifera indica]|uniref:fasciclin-like arabinogalactan protein 2 n=1 Tax=Mangifera indica TaxID=29780 RepID=UPI001CFA6935|nr:fasciclin-like arabinogalactan protein 2 [Mangifera indica]
MAQGAILITATLLPLLLTLFFFSSISHAHNITSILAKHPQFSTFNHYLTITHLAAEINRRQTITVLALDNAAMSSLLSKQYSVYTLRNVLSLHVLTDYFGSKKLHQITNGTALTSSMFQATGSASGSSGYVNITDLKGGKVGFGTEDNEGKLDASYVKSLLEMPYNISVLQISQPLNSAEAEAPTAGPSDLNLTAIMTKQGCKAFSDLLIATGARTTFEENLDGGLTVFCPSDTVINGFMPKYKNLTAARKVSLLLYHGIPVYQSLQTLKSSNGVVNTLATDGANKYDFTVQNDGEDVTLETKVTTATITGTVKDEEPLVIYKINKVLLPRELFKPEKEAVAPAPKTAKKKKGTQEEEADAPEDDSADATAADDQNGVNRMNGGGTLIWVTVSLCMAIILM